MADVNRRSVAIVIAFEILKIGFKHLPLETGFLRRVGLRRRVRDIEVVIHRERSLSSACYRERRKWEIPMTALSVTLGPIVRFRDKRGVVAIAFCTNHVPKPFAHAQLWRAKPCHRVLFKDPTVWKTRRRAKAVEVKKIKDDRMELFELARPLLWRPLVAAEVRVGV